MRVLVERKNFARSWAFESWSVKYQWPDEWSLKLEISPSTHTDGKRDSSEMRIEFVSWETVSGFRSSSSKSALKRGWFIWGILLRGCSNQPPDSALRKRRRVSRAHARE